MGAAGNDNADDGDRDEVGSDDAKIDAADVYLETEDACFPPAAVPVLSSVRKNRGFLLCCLPGSTSARREKRKAHAQRPGEYQSEADAACRGAGTLRQRASQRTVNQKEEQDDRENQ